MTDEWIDGKKKYILYVIICLAYLSNGIDLALVGPAVKDLAALMKEKTEENVLRGFSIRSFANGVGSLIACYTCNRFSRQIQYTVSICAYGIATIFLPFLTNIKQYLFLSAIFGFSSAFIDLGTNLFVLELFQNDRLNLHVQIVHFSLSVGQTIGPLMLGPFLAASQSNIHLNQSFISSVDMSNGSLVIENYAKTTNIFVPFTLGGILFTACSIAMFVCWMIHPYRQPNRTIDGKDRAQCQVDGVKSVKVPIYLENCLKIKGINNTTLIALVGIFYIVGRGCNVIMSALKISVTFVLYLNIVILLSGSSLILYVSSSTPNLSMLMTLVMILMGIGYSSCLPGIYVFIEKRINITTTLNSSMIAISTGVFCVESYRMSSKMNLNSDSFKEMNFLFTIAFALSFVLLHLTDLIRPYLSEDCKSMKPLSNNLNL